MARKLDVRNSIILGIRNAKAPQTARQLGVSAANMNAAVKSGLVEDTGQTVKETEGRGRPSKLYRLSKAGQGKATNLQKAIKKAHAEMEGEKESVGISDVEIPQVTDEPVAMVA